MGGGWGDFACLHKTPCAIFTKPPIPHARAMSAYNYNVNVARNRHHRHHRECVVMINLRDQCVVGVCSAERVTPELTSHGSRLFRAFGRLYGIPTATTTTTTPATSKNCACGRARCLCSRNALLKLICNRTRVCVG